MDRGQLLQTTILVGDIYIVYCMDFSGKNTFSNGVSQNKIDVGIAKVELPLFIPLSKGKGRSKVFIKTMAIMFSVEV